jgi:hypothetical protein
MISGHCMISAKGVETPFGMLSGANELS